MTTRLCFFDASAALARRSSSTMRSLSFGVSPALTAERGRPTASAMALALAGLSPVSINTSMPSPRRHEPARRSATDLAAFGWSESANRKTHARFSDCHAASTWTSHGASTSTSTSFAFASITDPAASRTARAATALDASPPVAAARRISPLLPSSPRISHAQSGFPNRASRAGPHASPSSGVIPGVVAARTKPSTPHPATTRKSLTAIAGSDPVGWSDAVSRTARAMGCVAPRSSDAAMANAAGDSSANESFPSGVDTDGGEGEPSPLAEFLSAGSEFLSATATSPSSAFITPTYAGTRPPPPPPPPPPFVVVSPPSESALSLDGVGPAETASSSELVVRPIPSKKGSSRCLPASAALALRTTSPAKPVGTRTTPAAAAAAKTSRAAAQRYPHVTSTITAKELAG
mmetsp:Transcript_6834/g.27862  ORF Transcript_6834/g.27862 Transcript_6834/m.27862 type:complete len:406 (+) Transcript_6834:3006-4223(+)